MPYLDYIFHSTTNFTILNMKYGNMFDEQKTKTLSIVLMFYF